MSLLADLVLVTHALWLLFVIGGQILVLVGLWRGWRWVRGFRFRLVHLLAIAFVVIQTWLGATCPLTILEDRLRVATGGDPYARGFVADWLARLIFYEAAPHVFVVAYTAFGLLVVLTWLLGPPRRGRRASRQRES
jgi:hypothetical protein